LQRVQPGAVVEQQVEPTTGELLFSVITVNQADQLARQGLLGVAWETNTGGNSNPVMLPATGSLLLPGTDVTLQPPYTLQWSGALRVATPGNYRIAFDSTVANGTWPTTPAAQPLITLQLDNRLILDTALGLLAQDVSLVKGFYQVSLLYRTPADADADTPGPTSPRPFALRWQRPDGVDEIIPRTALYNLPLPNLGLIGAYYWGDSQQGEPFDLRKDLVVGLTAARNEPYSVRWRGQLAAPRTGEYLLAALSAPGARTQLFLDGIQLFDTTLVAPAEATTEERITAATSAYAEGTIFLTRGWHELVVDYVPDPAAPTMQLFWQPPGSGPTALDLTYLAPSLTPLLETDRALPNGPPVANGTGDNEFALSYGTEFWQPQIQIPPGSLPALGLEIQWQIGSCGAADDQLDQPHGVALSGVRQLIYVADSANRRVVEYTLAGAVNRIYSSPDWQEPFAVTLIDDGFPVVLDATTQELYDLHTGTGAVEPRPLRSSFYYPRGLAVDRAANLLVADTGGARVVQLTPAGEELRVFGGQGTQLGRGQPTDVAGTNDGLWTVTAEDGRLWHLESGGSLTAIERTNTINGPHLAALPNGTLFLTDPARRLVLYLAATGEPLAHLAVPTLLVPTGVAAATIDDLLYLAVVDSGNCQLALWRTPLAMLPPP
jgi:sugar lactone lactonase YvrE